MLASFLAVALVAIVPVTMVFLGVEIALVGAEAMMPLEPTVEAAVDFLDDVGGSEGILAFFIGDFVPLLEAVVTGSSFGAGGKAGFALNN